MTIILGSTTQTAVFFHEIPDHRVRSQRSTGRWIVIRDRSSGMSFKNEYHLILHYRIMECVLKKFLVDLIWPTKVGENWENL